ncbi:MAG: elongator complex protein 3 [Thermodesulfobacteriota bacterium]
MISPLVIPIFIAHEGCPHRCLFCDQRAISGAGGEAVGPAQVVETVRLWLSRPRRHGGAPVEVAFYGGSFTMLPRSRQEELLAAVQPFLRAGQVGGIRLSTRPDAIDDGIADFLRRHRVSMVELGAQSLSDSVLAGSRRGHTAAQVGEAVACLRRAGLRVGLQLMLGLPGDSTRRARASAEAAAALRPDLVRLYPTLVIEGSPLSALYRQGRYAPLSLHKAVALAGRMWRIFASCDIPVARMGLQPSASLDASLLAGPHHPAFGELVLSRQLFNAARRCLCARERGKPHRLAIASADHSIFRGQRGIGMKRLAALGLLDGVDVVFSDCQQRMTVELSLAE